MQVVGINQVTNASISALWSLAELRALGQGNSLGCRKHSHNEQLFYSLSAIQHTSCFSEVLHLRFAVSNLTVDSQSLKFKRK